MKTVPPTATSISSQNSCLKPSWDNMTQFSLCRTMLIPNHDFLCRGTSLLG
ncbi:rCG54750 [Rattus norvegicus]|uniref:RCG54750 n=1 Tax=Rattus norvegicus TaxID=10116 RepID=A6IJ53_RAT|nr:rCG54750 [Rattus norvegicus]